MAALSSSTAFSWCSPSTETPLTLRSWSPRLRPPTRSATPPATTSRSTTCTKGRGWWLTWDDAGDVDGRVLLFAPHDVEPEALLGLWQFYNPGVGVAFTGREGRHGGLGGGWSSDFGVAFNVDRFVNMLVDFSNSVEEIGLQDLLQRGQLCRRDLAAVLALLELLEEFAGSFDVCQKMKWQMVFGSNFGKDGFSYLLTTSTSQDRGRARPSSWGWRFD